MRFRIAWFLMLALAASAFPLDAQEGREPRIQPASEGRGEDLSRWVGEGVRCLLDGVCGDYFPESPAKECIRLIRDGETSDLSYRSFGIVGDSCKAPPQRENKLGGFLKKLWSFLGKVAGLPDIHLSLLDDIHIVVIYAPSEAIRTPPPPPPAPGPVATPVVMVRFNQVVNFDFDKDQMTANGNDTVKVLVNALNEDPLDFKYLTIVGHADAVGTVAYNQGLSERRAAGVEVAVQAYARIARVGILSNPIGVGKSQLLVPTSERSYLNRRVEFFFSTSKGANENAIDYLRCLHARADSPAACYDQYLDL